MPKLIRLNSTHYFIMNNPKNIAHSPYGKVSEKQIKKQDDALNSLNVSSKRDELKRIEINPQDQFNDLIIDNLKEIKLKNNIKLDDLEHKN